jgi:hypothetical protein
MAHLCISSIGVDPLSKRIVLSWIATDIIWAALFIWVQKRQAG